MAVTINGNSIIFRACTSRDPNDSLCVEQEIWCDFFDVTPVPVGENVGDADTGTRLQGRTSIRNRYIFESHPMKRSRTIDPGESAQHIGVGIRFINYMAFSGTHPHLYIMQTFARSAANPGLGPIPYGGVDMSDGSLSEDDNFLGQSTDTPAGLFPREIVLDGEPEFTRTEDGVRTLSFTAWDAEITTLS